MGITPLRLVLLAGVLMLLVLVSLGMVNVAFDKLGLTASSALLLTATSIVGSFINLPLAVIQGDAGASPVVSDGPPILSKQYHGATLLAINVGGCLVPLSFCIYLTNHAPLHLMPLATAIAVVTLVSYRTSRPIPGAGIAISAFLPSIVAAALSLMLNPEQAATTAYISGTLGVLFGADLLRLRSIRGMRAPVASIGGAGTFDGIFITGIVAALLA